MSARSSLRAYYESAGVTSLLQSAKRWGSALFADKFVAAFQRSATTSYGSPELDAGVKRARKKLQAEIKKWVDSQLKAYHASERTSDEHLVLSGYKALADALTKVLRQEFHGTASLSDAKLGYIVTTLVHQAEMAVIKEYLKILDAKTHNKEPPR